MTLLIVLLLVPAPSDTLRLGHAHRASAGHWPGVREAGIAREIRDLRLANLDAAFRPSVSLGGQAVYHSNVADIPIDVPGVDLPSVSHDQYRLGLTVDQLVYDGGLTSALRALERSASDVAEAEVAVATWSLREHVEAAWFGVLLADAERAALDVLATDLEARLRQAESRAERGVSTGTDADVLRAEIIRTGQRVEAARSRRRAGLDALEILTGWDLPDDAVLESPGAGFADADGRPELALFASRRADLRQRADLAGRSNRPRVTTFAEASVGRPRGLDLFEDTIGPFFSMGIRVGWPVWTWKRAGREREAIRLQADAVQAREEAFLQGVRAEAASVRREIERLESHLEGDARILQLRAAISEEARSKLDNGVITATDFLVERNEEQRARLTEETHRIQLSRARVQLITILGGPRAAPNGAP